MFFLHEEWYILRDVKCDTLISLCQLRRSLGKTWAFFTQDSSVDADL